VVSRLRTNLARILTAFVLPAVGLACGQHEPSAAVVAPTRSLLIAALASEGTLRVVSGRLAGFPYASPASDRAGIGPWRQERWTALGHSIERSAHPPTTATLADQALLKFATGRRSQAVALLRRAWTPGRSPAWLASDLSALLLASSADEPSYAIEALEFASLATELHPRLHEARFNLGLAQEKFFLEGQAMKTWRSYLLLDPTSQWADEARSHLQRLERSLQAETGSSGDSPLVQAATRGDSARLRQLIARDPLPVLSFVEEQPLASWALAVTTGDDAMASHHLATARAVAAGVAAQVGDSLLADAIATIDQAIRRGAARGLAEAHLAYGRGRRLCQSNQSDEGSRLLRHALVIFKDAASPYVGATEMSLAGCRFSQSHPQAALTWIEPLLAGPESDRYPALAAKAHWIEGMSRLVLGQPGAALHAYARARSEFVRLQSPAGLGAIDQLLYEAYRYLGEEHSAWRFLHGALESSFRSNDLRRRYTSLNEVAAQAGRQHLWAAERCLRDEVLRLAYRDSSDVGAIVFALLRRGESSLRTGRRDVAGHDLAEARRLCPAIANRDERRLRAADLLLSEGRLALGADPARALELLRGAGATLLVPELKGYWLELFRVRARAHLDLGEHDEALADARHAIAEFEAERSQVPEEQLRLQFAEQERELFEIAIALLAEHPSGMASSFAIIELAHGRTLLEAVDTRDPGAPPIGPDGQRLLSLSEIRRRLPVGVVAIEFAVLEDRTLAWIVRRGNARLVHIDTPRAVLDESIHALSSALAAGPEGAELGEVEERAETAYRLILSPLSQWLEPGEQVVIVPDRSLALLPFAAMRDPRTHGYFAQGHASSYCLSMNLYVRSLRRDGRLAERHQAVDVLAVGDPRIDRRANPSFSSLPGATAEAKLVAGIYAPHSLLLPPQDARKEVLLRAAGDHVIVHLAGHAIADRLSLTPSRLFLAAVTGKDTDTLGDHDIRAVQFARTRLVVLAACDTGGGPATAGEGILSLARSFLAAGVPNVIATLWEIDDQASVAIFTGLHQRLRDGKSPAAALRGVQLDLLQSPEKALRSPATWAGIQVFNGTSPID